MKRREFIWLLGGAAVARPVAARAQQPRPMPVVGVLSGPSAADWMPRVELFRQSLYALGYIERRNVRYEYRWADGKNDRLPALAVDLVRRQVSVIYASGADAGALAATSATNIPIVFTSGSDPIALGLFASISRPGGNVTGTTAFGGRTRGFKESSQHFDGGEGCDEDAQTAFGSVHSRVVEFTGAPFRDVPVGEAPGVVVFPLFRLASRAILASAKPTDGAAARQLHDGHTRSDERSDLS